MRRLLWALPDTRVVRSAADSSVQARAGRKGRAVERGTAATRRQHPLTHASYYNNTSATGQFPEC